MPARHRGQKSCAANMTVPPSTRNISLYADLTLKMFDWKVMPIITYGCPILRMPKQKKHQTANISAYVRQCLNMKCETLKQITLRSHQPPPIRGPVEPAQRFH